LDAIEPRDIPEAVTRRVVVAQIVDEKARRLFVVTRWPVNV
jgi:hypothetical protein